MLSVKNFRAPDKSKHRRSGSAVRVRCQLCQSEDAFLHRDPGQSVPEVVCPDCHAYSLNDLGDEMMDVSDDTGPHLYF